MVQTPAVDKTPAQRKAELSAILSAPANKPAPSTIPPDVCKAIEALAGQEVTLGNVKIDTVPEANGWKVVQTSKGKTIYTALDTFALRSVGMIAGREVCIKVSMVIR